MELFSHESESQVLSGMMANEHMLCLGIETLEVTDFYSEQSQTIFCVMKQFYEKNETPNLPKLIIAVKEFGGLERMGGIAQLTERVCKYISTVQDFSYYANEVKSKSILRQIALIIDSFKEKLNGSDNVSGFDLLQRIKGFLEKITDFRSDSLGLSFKEECLNLHIPRLLEALDGNVDDEEEIRTGFGRLDALVSGMSGGQIWTICARTGVGKTSLALNLALNLAKAGKNVYFFSLEMTNKELSQRLMAQLSDIPHERIKKKTVSHEDVTKISHSLEDLDSSSLVINDKCGLKINELCSIARRAKEHYSVCAFFVDYLQLIEPNTTTEFRHLDIAHITRSLKKLAKDLNVPIIALAQLSRKVEERASQQIFLSDLKESGSIEEDSDVVLSINRRDIKDPYDRPGEAVLSVLKNRHGQTGDVKMRFEKEKCRFVEIA